MPEHLQFSAHAGGIAAHAGEIRQPMLLTTSTAGTIIFSIQLFYILFAPYL
jgi:hypothetical protein